LVIASTPTPLGEHLAHIFDIFGQLAKSPLGLIEDVSTLFSRLNLIASTHTRRDAQLNAPETANVGRKRWLQDGIGVPS
jgi:hypothetical protein